MRDHGGATMDFRDGSEVDGEGEFDLLALAQSQHIGTHENAGGAQIHRATQVSLASRQDHVDGSARTMSRVKSPFHS